MFWLDGALAHESVAPFDLMDRGLLLGVGTFDTSLVLNGAMVWRAAHLARLAASCAALGLPLDRDAVEAAITALTRDVGAGALRITVTGGAGPRGLAPPAAVRPRIFASCAPFDLDRLFRPVTLQVSTIRRNETAPTARLKTLAYLDAVQASRAAARDGFDDALFLNTKGHLACATVGNIVAIIEGRLVTPPVEDGVLPGITRAALLRLCPDVGLERQERSMALDDLGRADAVFLTSSLKLMAPVTRVGAVPIQQRYDAGPLVAALRRDCGLSPGPC